MFSENEGGGLDRCMDSGDQVFSVWVLVLDSAFLEAFSFGICL